MAERGYETWPLASLKGAYRICRRLDTSPAITGYARQVLHDVAAGLAGELNARAADPALVDAFREEIEDWLSCGESKLAPEDIQTLSEHLRDAMVRRKLAMPGTRPSDVQEGR